MTIGSKVVEISGLRGAAALRARIGERVTAALEPIKLEPVSAQVAFFDDNGPKGGGIRCAFTVRLPYQKVDPAAAPAEAEVPDQSGVTPVGQPYPPPHPEFVPVNGRYPSLADQIVLISSVSGGSLATAYYVHQSYPHVRAVRGRQLDPDTPVVQAIARGMLALPPRGRGWTRHATGPRDRNCAASLPSAA